jgi:hypothetical protein
MMEELTSSRQSWSWVRRSAMVALSYAASNISRDEVVFRVMMAGFGSCTGACESECACAG